MPRTTASTVPKRLPTGMVRAILLGLVALALLAVVIRVLLSVFAPSAASGSAWAIQLDYQLDAARAGAKIDLAPPWDSRGARLYGQQLDLTGLRIIRSKSGDNGRQINMVARHSGPVAFHADFSVHLFPGLKREKPEKVALAPHDRARYLAAEPGIDPGDSTVASALTRVEGGAGQDKDLVERIFTYVRKSVAFNDAHGAATAADALKRGIGNGLGRARAMVALCRAARIPARLVTGFILASQDNPAPHHWVQVYRARVWRDYDPEFGFRQQLPENFVAFSHGTPMVSVHGGHITDAGYDITEQDVPASTAGGGEGANPLHILDLARLPLSARATLATLLLLPLGALLNAMVRTMVGVQTYGTFSPALLALAAVYVNWLTAAVIFVVVAVIAFFGRSMLPGLRLTRSPRLTIVFTLVALAMALAISIMAFFGLLTGAQVVLLPIVILTSLVDRIYSVADEKGLRTALVRLLWTVLTAVGCFFLLTSDDLGELLVRYPELHLITIAGVLLLAQYRGRALSDHPRLRWLGEADTDK